MDDHQDPVTELKRLLHVHRAYESMNQGDLAMEKGRMEEAEEHYREAEGKFPENEEMVFWHAVAMVNNQRATEGERLLIQVFRRNRRLPRAGQEDIGIGSIEDGPTTIEDLGSGIFSGK